MRDLRRPLARAVYGLTTLSLLALAAGCEPEPRHVNSSTPKPPANAGVPAPAPAPVAAPTKPADTFIVGQKTTDIKPTTDAMPKNAQIASQKITAKDPITLQGNAYVTSIGQIAINNIKHAMDLFHASEGRYPKDFAEFKAQIIDANNIALPKLPFYQEYRYNESTHALEVWEDPVKKAGPMPGG
ncbi:MAG: hypothetical protein P4L84_18950 [Isosphaeraceae bacterium]|nr:hypothetical protein [Isosphaeraceae bacterium]